MMRLRFQLSIVVLVALLIAGCTHQAGERTPLRVIAAGSLLFPFSQAEPEFEAMHPDIDVEIEGHGSIQVIRQVTDLHRKADVVAVADASLIPDLMYRNMEGSTDNYTNWYIPVATNEMVIVYTNKSRYASEVTSKNWPEVLSRPDVRVGFSNPMLDAAGYRALMVMQLAEGEYQDPRLFDVVIGDHFSPPLNVSTQDDVHTISLPEIMRPADEKVVIRDGSIYLLSLLEAGGIDYAFEYRSVAEAMDMPYVTLPSSINLGSSASADEYRKVRVILGFQRFSSIGRERTGQPIIYALTIPANAPHPEMAKEFLDYIVQESKKGRPGWPAPLE